MANKTLDVRITLRSDTAANFASANPVLLKGEAAYETDTNKLKFGDGTTHYADLPYFAADVGETIEALLTNYMKVSEYQGSTSGVVKAADKLAKAVTINGVSFDGSANITVEDNTKIPTSQKGAANGVATLDTTGKVPSSQLPSYVDDVIEGYYSGGKFYTTSAHTTEITGEGGKIYVDITDGAGNAQYRYTGTAYVSISNPLDYATQSDATAGTDNEKVMTPLRVKQAIDVRGFTTTAVANAAYEPKIDDKKTAFNVDFGTTAGTAAEGNDPRRSDARTPTGAAGGDLTGNYPNPTVANGKITDAKIAANALSTSKLFVPSGDTLVLDGGDSGAGA